MEEERKTIPEWRFLCERFLDCDRSNWKRAALVILQEQKPLPLLVSASKLQDVISRFFLQSIMGHSAQYGPVKPNLILQQVSSRILIFYFKKISKSSLIYKAI